MRRSFRNDSCGEQRRPRTRWKAPGANRDLAGYFADYAVIVARALGDRITTWAMFNEPYVFADAGYGTGVHAPGRKGGPALFQRVAHTVNLAQGDALAP